MKRSKPPRVTLVRVSKVQAAILQRAGVQTFTTKDLVPVDSVPKSPYPVPSEELLKMDSQTHGQALAAQKKAPRTMERLSQAEYYKLYKWLEDPDIWGQWTPGVTAATVATAASSELGFKITEWIIRGALETCGLALPVAKRQLPAEEKAAVLARLLSDLCDGLLLCLPIDEGSRRALAGLRDEAKGLL